MKLALIGVGLIGGSFAKALRVAGKVTSVVGFDVSDGALKRALDSGVIDEHAASAGEAVSDADLVVLSTPVGRVAAVLAEIAPRLSERVVVTDVGSSKLSAVTDAQMQLAGAAGRFVPGHPIAGSEQSGVENASETLFHDRLFISTPWSGTNDGALRFVEALWTSVGCRVERMSAEEHDRIFASVSHLPHLLAFTLLAQIKGAPDADRRVRVAGAGLRDFTRIANSNIEMWAEIFVANRQSIVEELSAYRQRLEQLQLVIESGNVGDVEEHLR